MRIKLDGKDYTFCNDRTKEIRKEQKIYLMKLIEECEKTDDKERVITALYSLLSLSSDLLSGIVKKLGKDEILNILSAIDISSSPVDELLN
jgi:hypothetical protein